MRNIVFTLLISLFICGCASSDNKDVSETQSSSYMSWTPLNTPLTGIFAPPDGISYYGLSLDFSEKSKDSYGLSMGLISETKNSYLISTQLLWSENDNFSGLAASALTIQNTGTTNGITLAPFLFEREFIFGNDFYLPIFLCEIAFMMFHECPFRTPSYSALMKIIRTQDIKSVNNALNLNLFSYYVIHNGLSFSLESTALENNGLVVSGFLPLLSKNKGVAFGGFVECTDNEGLIVSAISLCYNKGVAVALLSTAEAELGGLNIGIITWNNFFGGKMNEFISRQIGVLNFLSPPEDDENAQTKGFQFGAINVARSGLQIGLININPNSKIFPVMPFVNW